MELFISVSWVVSFSIHQRQLAEGDIVTGPFYYLYMSMLSTFCTNSINILAGINGVEVCWLSPVSQY